MSKRDAVPPRPLADIVAIQVAVSSGLRAEMRANRKAIDNLAKKLAAFSDHCLFLKDLVGDYAKVHAADAQRVAFMTEQLRQHESAARRLAQENEMLKAADIARARRVARKPGGKGRQQ